MSSHPVWVRGLKLPVVVRPVLFHDVAPRVGAWIETFYYEPPVKARLMSHPVWVRGLKHLVVALDE